MLYLYVWHSEKNTTNVLGSYMSRFSKFSVFFSRRTISRKNNLDINGKFKWKFCLNYFRYIFTTDNGSSNKLEVQHVLYKHLNQSKDWLRPTEYVFEEKSIRKYFGAHYTNFEFNGLFYPFYPFSDQNASFLHIYYKNFFMLWQSKFSSQYIQPGNMMEY